MTPRPRRSVSVPVVGLAPDPLWYKTAIIYEVHVRAFGDSNGDGIGDFPGLTERLDYLQDLGVTALWLLPFYPSPLRDGGYDIADYTDINPVYGTMDEFQRFLDEAHQRGLRVITELVLNHTSSEHVWFQRARAAAPGSPERDFYVWSDTADRYPETRIIFKDFETSNWAWDPVARAYYWHRFYGHQPDLNFDNPAVHEALLGVVDFWFDRGVDGLRLDAVPYLYERDGTTCENLPETHRFLKALRAHVDAKYQDRMLLAEANQWPIDAAEYFGAGDECHMNFHFPLMPRMFMALQMEDRFPIVDILRQTPAIPETCQWATFLRNHDELTLEMVTDEERDYMYRVYTEDPNARINLGIRRRLAPLLGSRRKIELMKALLFSLPGTPVLYYGDEIGMGDNVYLGDRDGVRTPMQWSADRNGGFSRVNPQRSYLPVIIDPEYHYEAINVEAQEANPQSLLWWTKRLIALRKEHPVLGFGDISFLLPENPKVLAFLRSWRGEAVLIVANLSRQPQFVELDLAAHAGKTPVEMIGRTRFPAITDRPYGLSFGPHMFLWFELEAQATEARARPTLAAVDVWTAITGDQRTLARAVASYASARRWFRSKARTQRRARVVDLVDLAAPQSRSILVVVEIEFTDGEPETYVVPVAFVAGEPAVHLEHRAPSAVIANVEVTGRDAARGVLYDALATGEAAQALLAIASGDPVAGRHGRLIGSSTAALADGADEPTARPLELEQTNSSVPFGDRWILKVFRAIEPGINAEIEIGTYLTTRIPEVRVPPMLGTVVYQRDGVDAAVAIVHGQVAHQGTAWDLFAGELDKLFETALASGEPAPDDDPTAHLLELVGRPAPAVLVERSGHYLRHAHLLGRRIAEVHLALAAARGPGFTPERFTVMYQQSLFQRVRASLVRTFETLARRLDQLPEEVRDPVRAALAAQGTVEGRLRAIQARPIDAIRIRIHGDLHLGQVLFTGDDFVVIDFEGEPGRPMSERRYKRSALRDLGGMLRSFGYAADAAMRTGATRAQDYERVRPWGAAWTRWVSAELLAGYLELAESTLIPRDPAVRRLLLDFFLLEKCVYEIGYELHNRPDWLPIPVRGLLSLIGA
jgi:maltose alpha-D-glucosyltransferase / alpha-amylase